MTTTTRTSRTSRWSATGATRARTLVTRLLAGTGLALAVAVTAGGAALAAEDDSDTPVVPAQFVPTAQLAVPEIGVSPIAPVGPDLPEVLDLPDDLADIPEGPELPDIPDLELPELPEPCLTWDPAQTATVHSDPVAGTVSVMISYLGDTADTCDTLFVVHSIALDEAMNPAGLLAEEHVSMDDLDANGGSVTVAVPIDPCRARVFTDGPEAYVLADTTYGEGCPTDTTEPTEPTGPTEPTEPTEPTVPVPGGELPATGSSSTAIALLGGVLIATGLGLACAVRGTQVRNTARH